MYHELAPGAVAEVIAGTIAEVMAGVIVRVTLEVSLWVDGKGHLLGLNPEGG